MSGDEAVGGLAHLGAATGARDGAAREKDSAPAAATATAATEPRERTALSVSVVICTRDRPDTIGRAVESVATQPCQDFDVLVVDQSRTDETRTIVEALGERYPHVRYLRLAQPGLSRASNVGIRESAGTVIAFTDDDCVAPPDWLATIAERFAAAPDIAMLYGQVLSPPEIPPFTDGTVIPALRIPARRRLSRRDGFQVFGMGANYAVRRDAFERVRGFDEVLGGGGPLRSSQDYDFAFRIFRDGGTILLEPEVIVYHYGMRTRAEWPATLKAYGIGDGGFYFKHVRAGDLYALRLLLGIVVMQTLRAGKATLLRGWNAEYWTYLRNVFVGLRASLHFGVDRGSRMYYTRRAQ